jgi:hypothetical protein
MWIMGSRSPGNDLRLEHETALLDLAAGQVFLREVVGYENVVLQGTSGGGPLAAFYIQQAGYSPDARIARTPGGRPVPLGRAMMPMPDGVVFISAHLGQGMLMLDSIDPAVTDEADPLKTEQALSAFAAENGFRPPPETARYTPVFLAAYRAAQRRRVELIDAAAHALLARKAEGRRRAKDGFSAEDAILAAFTPIFQVWRTDADPRCFDLSLDPSDRAYGSLWGGNPMASNYGSVGFGRVCTPESWLSNWSGLSSNAATLACVPRVGCPVLMIEYTGDNSVFPADAERIWQAIGSTRKTRHRVHGNHHGQRVDPAQPLGQAVAGQHIRDWLEAHRLV